MSAAAVFEARFFIYDDRPIEISVWCYGFLPMKETIRSAEEWIVEHLQCLGEDEIRKLCELPADGDYQVIAKGSIVGSFDYWGEYDEWLSFSESRAQSIPASYKAEREESQQSRSDTV